MLIKLTNVTWEVKFGLLSCKEKSAKRNQNKSFWLNTDHIITLTDTNLRGVDICVINTSSGQGFYALENSDHIRSLVDKGKNKK